MAEVLVIDIGNTSAHWAVVADRRVTQRGDVHRDHLITELPTILSASNGPVSWCSVVPATADNLSAALNAADRPHWRLTCDDAPGLTITYERPQQIGQDRLANALGAQALVSESVVVIDMGTATTFDIVSASQGFIGGIIAPGLASMTHYMHEKTALLPQLSEEDFDPSLRIGRSTVQAMSVGCTRGYPGMIRGMLEGVREEYAALGEAEPAVVLTGGAARGFLRDALAEFRAEPDLTLLGLAEAQRRRIAIADG
ncbi:type III pantothenate kinase [Cerasicoccus maritimus]|uniref:type III pantothenate kinase n=1 Tax=Cerasicoccus maritimus TaxID=490089 RepID=UPI0028529BCA|nr:type III pantothenate kinase [Cerasicoccus maritimus]